MPRIRLLPLLAAMLLVLAGAADAHAGQYTLTYDFAGDLSGWSGYVEPGYLLCGRGATAGCPDVSTNRILAQPGAGQAVWSQGRWEWTAPPGTLIVGGSLAYRTRMRHSQFYARVKMRADGVTWEAAPTLVNEQQTTALTDHVIPLAAGFRQVGVALYAHPAAGGVVTDVWDDYVTLVRLVVTVQDATAPALIWVDGGGLLDGAWHRGDVCATFGARRRTNRAPEPCGWPAARRPPSGTRPPPARSTSRRRRTPSRASAWARQRSATASMRAPSAVWTRAAGSPRRSRSRCGSMRPRPSPGCWRRAPSRPTRAPASSCEVGDATSGVGSAVAQIDGVTVPLDLSGARASGRPATPLASARTRSRGRSPTSRATALKAAHASTCPIRRRRRLQHTAAAERDSACRKCAGRCRHRDRRRGGRGAGISREGRAHARGAGARPAGAGRVVPATSRDR